MMMSKAPCKFKGTCKNYREGKQCNFSHQQCKFGNACNNIQNCKFFHKTDQTSSKSQSKHDKPIGEVQCKFGAKCTRRLEGKCFFRHSEIGNPSPTNPIRTPIISQYPPKVQHRVSMPKSQILCKNGDRCTFLPLGKCPYKHEQSTTHSAQGKNHLIVLDNLCMKFLTNNSCGENCSKIHQYSETKTISNIFTVSNCGKQVKKIMILEPYQPDEQPLYVIVGNNRVIFGQLTNLAKQSGNEHVSNNILVMKRWCDRDIYFQGDEIHNAWLIKTQSQHNERVDILTIKCKDSIKIICINKQRMVIFPITEDIKSVIFIGNTLFILGFSKQTYAFEFNFARTQFREYASPLNMPLLFLRKHHKTIQGEQFACGGTEDGRLCFINKNLQTFVANFNQKIKDACFTQYNNLPAVLALTEKGTVLAINLLTYESAIVLNGNLPQGLSCSSLTLTFDHLFLAIDGFGVLVYNYEQFGKTIGVLALGNQKWTVQCNQRGNVALISQDRQGKVDAKIFKLRKL